MKKITFSFPLACLLLFNGCSTDNAFMDNIGKIGGTTVGAGAGAVVGKQLGGRGGLIAGALIGGTIGYLIGDEIDKRRAELAKIAKEEKVEVYSEDVTTANIAIPEQNKQNDTAKKAEVIGDSFTVISDDNQFNIGSSSLNSKSTQVFTKFAQQYKNSDKKLLIIGHTDDSGVSSFNQKLSEERARNVGQIFNNQGIKQTNIYYLGAGEMNPIADNNSEIGASKNRRVEIVELKNESDISNFALAKSTNLKYFRKVAPVVAKAEKKSTDTKESVSKEIPIRTVDKNTQILVKEEIVHKPIIEKEVVTEFINFNGTKVKNNSFALTQNFGIASVDKPKFSLINTAQASDDATNVYVNCVYDKPRTVGKTKSLETGKNIEYSTTEFKKGLNEVPWIAEVDSNLIGINPVGVLSNGSKITKNPNVTVYKNYLAGSNKQADLAMSTSVNTYQGSEGLIYRIFLDDKNNQLKCMDIVFNEKNINGSTGIVYYSKNDGYYERTFTVKQLDKK